MTFRATFAHRDELLHAALDEFCAWGYESASINRILAVAGVSKGQLYHQFEGKQGLYLSLIEWMIDEKIAWFATHPPEMSEDVFATLETQLEAALTFAAEHTDVDRLSRSVLAERGHPIFTVIEERFAFDGDGALGALVASAYDEGQFRDDVSIDVARRTILLVVNHLPELVEARGAAEMRAQLAEVMTFVRRGLARVDSGASPS